MRIAFVTSGGAVKAACFHVGVCLALQEKGYVFQGGSPDHPRYPSSTPNLIDIYVGSSAGSFISSFLASGFSLEDILTSFAEQNRKGKGLKKITYWQMFHFGLPHWETPLKLFSKKRVVSATGGVEALLRNYLFMTGLASTKGIEKYLSSVLPYNHFNELAADLFIVATQLNHSKRTVFGKFSSLQYLTEGDTCDYTDAVNISQAVAASASLPPFYRPYRVKYKNGRIEDFFDGEIRKTLSTHVAKDVGADLIIASYTHQPYHYSKEVGSLADFGMTPILTQAIYQTIEQKIAINRRYHNKKAVVIETVDQFFKEHQLPDAKRKTIVELLEQKLDYRPNLRYLYIHPQPNNYEMFFGDHFNLSPKVMEAQMKIGFKSALQALRRFETS